MHVKILSFHALVLRFCSSKTKALKSSACFCVMLSRCCTFSLHGVFACETQMMVSSLTVHCKRMSFDSILCLLRNQRNKTMRISDLTTISSFFWSLTDWPHNDSCCSVTVRIVRGCAHWTAHLRQTHEARNSGAAPEVGKQSKAPESFCNPTVLKFVQARCPRACRCVRCAWMIPELLLVALWWRHVRQAKLI